jgi:pimeloyl-ACP methyl ester carboxylesterase
LNGGGDGDGDGDDGGVRVYALDLLGSGWSSKPPRDDPMAMAANGENGRFLGCDSVSHRDASMMGGVGGGGGGGSNEKRRRRRTSPILENVPMGTSWGGHRVAPTIELRHPLGSPYNFYTWAEQIADFTRDVIHAEDDGVDVVVGGGMERTRGGRKKVKKVTLVANSIGTVSSLQSMIDEPTLYNGILVVNPNFRELHSAEVPLSPLAMPILRRVQKALRENGRSLFRTLATPPTVKRILEEPYAVRDAIDDELVSVLLDPLLTNGADDVVFDALSYSAGPLPEQQLGSAGFPRDAPVWVVYGKDDPWTPGRRVENLGRVCVRPGYDDDGAAAAGGGGGGSPVERVVGLDGAGHCPHDEVPDEVNGLILEFLDRLGG